MKLATICSPISKVGLARAAGIRSPSGPQNSLYQSLRPIALRLRYSCPEARIAEVLQKEPQFDHAFRIAEECSNDTHCGDISLC